MKVAAVAIVMGVIVLANDRSSHAANLNPSVRPPAMRAVVTPPAARVYVRRTPVRYRVRRAVVHRTIGMPCVLPPHVIVQLNWNGPQCRWVDNVIPGDFRVRYRIVARR